MRLCHAGSPKPRLFVPQVALAAAIGLALAAMPVQAFHQSGTLSPSNPSLAWSNTQVVGFNDPMGGEGQCIEDTPTPGAGTCETYVLTLAPADYVENEIVVNISWANGGNDWDVYIHEDTADGPIVAQNVSFEIPDGTETETSFFIGSIVSPKTYYIRIVASSVTSPGYMGSARFLNLPTSAPTTTWGKIKTIYR